MITADSASGRGLSNLSCFEDAGNTSHDTFYPLRLSICLQMKLMAGCHLSPSEEKLLTGLSGTEMPSLEETSPLAWHGGMAAGDAGETGDKTPAGAAEQQDLQSLNVIVAVVRDEVCGALLCHSMSSALKGRVCDLSRIIDKLNYSVQQFST